MKVKDIYNLGVCRVRFRVVGYWNDYNYGILSQNEEDCNEDIMELDVIGLDSHHEDSENLIRISVSM